MSHKNLWAPWRMQYIKDTIQEANEDCVFCRLPKQSEDRENLILYRGKTAFVILNKYPYNIGHLMVVPFLHSADLTELTGATLNEMGYLSQKCVEILKEAYKAQGFNIGMNLGQAAGAGVKWHIHQHIVPRWNGDTNFMPVIGDVKSMPQHLLGSFDHLQEPFKKLQERCAD